MNELITTENVSTVLDELQAAYFDIPFENSAFQTEHFVINAQLTPARAYRAIGLRMFNRLRALEEARFNRMREDVDIEEMEHRLATEELDQFARRRLAIDIREKQSHRAYTDKLINDALTELNLLYQHFQRLPRFTRDEFEAGERDYFTESLTRQCRGVVGAAESLANMNAKTPALSFQTTKRTLKDGTGRS